jgi:hypothetical protein
MQVRNLPTVKEHFRVLDHPFFKTFPEDGESLRFSYVVPESDSRIVLQIHKSGNEYIITTQTSRRDRPSEFYKTNVSKRIVPVHNEEASLREAESLFRYMHIDLIKRGMQFHKEKHSELHPVYPQRRRSR